MFLLQTGQPASTMTQVFLPTMTIAGLIAAVPIVKQIVASIYIGRWVRLKKNVML